MNAPLSRRITQALIDEGLLHPGTDGDDKAEDGSYYTDDYNHRVGVLLAALSEPDERVGRAFDNLGGMWSWHDPSITAPPNKPGGLSEGWVTTAGRLLREVVGRPAVPPTPVAPPVATQAAEIGPTPNE